MHGMMPVRCARLFPCLVIAVACVVLGGCAGRSPWTFTTPPTRVEPNPVMRANQKTIVVVSTFADPTNAPPHAVGIGRYLSEAFSRALLNDGKYDVWINPALILEAERIAQARPVDRSTPAAGTRGPQIGGPDTNIALTGVTEQGRRVSSDQVHFVVLGKVTDFQYTGDLPRQVSRWGVFGPRNEAIVAIDLRIVDMQSRRVVGADHIRAMVPAGGTDARELHSAVPFDSYLFWSTPLGRASKEAVQTAVAQTDRVVPPVLLDPRIEQMIAWRRVSIAGGSMAGVNKGQELFVLVREKNADDPSGGRWVPARDAHTDEPLRVRIDTVERRHSTGWLLGERPVELNLRGALLSLELPTARDEPVQGPLANAPAEVGDE